MDDELRSLFQEIAADATAGASRVSLVSALKAKPRIAKRFPVTAPNSFCTTNLAMRCCCQVFNATTLSQYSATSGSRNAAEIHQIEDVLLETAATETGAGIEKFRANTAIGADRWATSRTSAPLASQKAAIELIELIRWARKALAVSLESSLLQVGAQDLLLRNPMGIDRRKDINGGRVVTTDQHPVWRF